MDATIQENTITTFATMATESIEEEEKLFNNPETEKLDQISVCKCLLDDDSSEKVEISARKRQILTTVARTESYLQERRIPELIRFLLTKVIAQASKKPVAYMEKLLNDCMLFRAGHGAPPVLYEHRHLEAIVRSFDPGHRGWLSAGQFRRAFITLGLIPEENEIERIPTALALDKLHQAQEMELMSLLRAGLYKDDIPLATVEKVSSSF